MAMWGMNCCIFDVYIIGGIIPLPIDIILHNNIDSDIKKPHS